MKILNAIAAAALAVTPLAAWSQTAEKGYYASDHSCFNWKGPNKQVYNVKWVGTHKFIDCGDGVEVFSDIFATPAYPLPEVYDGITISNPNPSFQILYGAPYKG